KASGVNALHELEVMWYELHKAESHLSKQEYGPALRELEYVFVHFNKFHDNQVDFHKFAYRRVCVISHVEMLQWENNLRSHPFYRRACIGAVETWLRVFHLYAQFNNETSEESKHNEELKAQLEKGSSIEDEDDKRQKRGKDPRGWELIHGNGNDGKGKYPLEEAFRWIKHWVTVAFEKDIEPHRWYIKVQHLRGLSKSEKEQKYKIFDDVYKSILQVCQMYNPRLKDLRSKFSYFLCDAIQFFHESLAICLCIYSFRYQYLIFFFNSCFLAAAGDDRKTSDDKPSLAQQARNALLQVYNPHGANNWPEFVGKYFQQVQSLVECANCYHLCHILNEKQLAEEASKKLAEFIPQATLKVKICTPHRGRRKTNKQTKKFFSLIIGVRGHSKDSSRTGQKCGRRIQKKLQKKICVGFCI
ncbi:hypothetical protein RFI_39755, partial [Reticulomyxa filosa]